MKLKNTFLTLLLGGLISACGGDGGTLSASGNASAYFTGGGNQLTGEISTFSTFLTGSALSTIPTFNGAVLLAGSPIDNCKKYTIGTDSNAKHFRVEYNCKNLIKNPSSPGAAVDYLGFIEQSVIDKADPAKGYSYEYDIYEQEVVKRANYDVNKGFHKLYKSGNSQVVESEMVFHTASDRYMATAGIKLDWGFKSQIKRAYIPDDTSDPVKSGKLMIEAFFKMEGDIGPGANQQKLPAIKVTFEVTSKSLEYDQSCPLYFSNGSIIYKDGSNNRLEYNYDGCPAQPAITWNGKTVTDRKSVV